MPLQGNEQFKCWLETDIRGDQPMGDTTDTQIYRQICLWQKEPCYKELLRVIKAIVALLPWHSLIVLFLPLVMPEPALPYLLLHCSCQHLPTWNQEPSMWGWKVTSNPWCHLNSNKPVHWDGYGPTLKIHQPHIYRDASSDFKPHVPDKCFCPFISLF